MHKQQNILPSIKVHLYIFMSLITLSWGHAHEKKITIATEDITNYTFYTKKSQYTVHPRISRKSTIRKFLKQNNNEKGRLFFGDVELEDSYTLEAYGIDDFVLLCEVDADVEKYEHTYDYNNPPSFFYRPDMIYYGPDKKVTLSQKKSKVSSLGYAKEMQAPKSQIRQRASDTLQESPLIKEITNIAIQGDEYGKMYHTYNIKIDREENIGTWREKNFKGRRLFFQEKELDDQLTFKDYGIGNFSLLFSAAEADGNYIHRYTKAIEVTLGNDTYTSQPKKRKKIRRTSVPLQKHQIKGGTRDSDYIYFISGGLLLNIIAIVSLVYKSKKKKNILHTKVYFIQSVQHHTSHHSLV